MKPKCVQPKRKPLSCCEKPSDRSFPYCIHDHISPSMRPKQWIKNLIEERAAVDKDAEENPELSKAFGDVYW